MDQLPPFRRTSVPCRTQLLRSILKFKRPPKYCFDSPSDVSFRLVQQGVEIDGHKIRAAIPLPVPPIGGIVPRLSHTPVLDKELSECRNREMSRLVLLLEGSNVQFALFRIGTVDRIIMPRFHLRSGANSLAVKPAEPCVGQTWWTHPHGVMLFDACTNHMCEPQLCLFILWQMVIDRQSYRGQKRWVRPRQIIGAVPVQNQSVVGNLIRQVLRQPLGQIDTVILQQPKRLKVTVPPVHFVETATGDNKWDTDVCLGRRSV